MRKNKDLHTHSNPIEISPATSTEYLRSTHQEGLLESDFHLFGNGWVNEK